MYVCMYVYIYILYVSYVYMHMYIVEVSTNNVYRQQMLEGSTCYRNSGCFVLEGGHASVDPELCQISGGLL